MGSARDRSGRRRRFLKGKFALNRTKSANRQCSSASWAKRPEEAHGPSGPRVLIDCSGRRRRLLKGKPAFHRMHDTASPDKAGSFSHRAFRASYSYKGSNFINVDKK